MGAGGMCMSVPSTLLSGSAPEAPSGLGKPTEKRR